MIQIKKKISKKQLTIILTASLLVILIAAYAIMSAIISSGVAGSGGGDSNSTEPPEIKDGEAIYNGRAVVYPYVSKGNIVSVAVSSHVDAFVMSRPETETKNVYEDYFMLYYGDENGELVAYYPEIMYEESGTDYKDFYATDGADGLNVYKIDYLCATIGALYFDQRIEPEDDREAQLNRYGLDEEHRETIYLSYLGSDGKLCEYKIFIGDSLITDVGYYFMIEGRDYIYTSSASERLEYLLSEFESFLHSRLIPEGLAADGIYEPYLTTDYKQWKNKYYGINSGGEGMYPTAGSEVIIYADIEESAFYPEGKGEGDGFDRYGYYTMSLDLSKLSKRSDLDRLIAALTKNAVGDYEGSEIAATVISNVNEAKIGSLYTYQIHSLDAVLTDSGEREDAGYPARDANLVKVSYSCTVDGKSISSEICHAVIDLSKENVIPQNVKNALLSASVGDKFDGENELSFSVTYTEENTEVRQLSLIITDIILISKIGAEGGVSYPKVIDEDCVVTYNYKYLVDGNEIGEEGISTVDLSSITDGENLKIKNALIGLPVSEGIDKCVLTEQIYCQPFMDFLTYRIRSIRGFVDREAVVSFEYVNASKRDPFYGESIYKNTLENENKYYALDALACQTVTFLLGGIGTSSSSQVSAGLLGSETVAVGLTPQNMDKYGLYDGHTVYFELPRGISRIGGSASNEVDDYTYLDTLGCYLYISPLQSDGTRYIGSSLYGIIAKIEGEQFNYLEKSFEEYWSRGNLVMVDYTIIDKVTLDLNMTDVFGKYEFDFDHKLIYISGNQHFDEMPEEGGTEYNFLTVNTRPLSDNCYDTLFSQILASEGREKLDIANVYNRVAGKPVASGHDTLGAASFKKILSLMYGTNYEGVIPEGEREELIASSPKIMSLSFRLNSSDFDYVYDFYRVSDRRVMVQIYRVDSEGNAIDKSADDLSGFFISNFAAKKIVNAFDSLLNGQTVNADGGYWD